MATATAPSASQPAKVSALGPVTDGPASRPTRQTVDATLVSFATDQTANTADDLRRVRDVRQTVKQRLALCGLSDLADDVVLVVSELITNAILHSRGGTEVNLLMGLRDGLLLIIVTDGTPTTREARHAGDAAEHGRGLGIVRAIAAEHRGSWGTTSDRTGTWCELPVPGLGRAA
ncbi:ATP-binding protein [Streptomyces sp. WAC05292]|uniref:ATP-binding protein n=1 Tax=Streptomyces sp. WAC05292 TaxID=2487418 RepID=UPI000F747C36|nr:ATP-binding protein [Streptomyces sp. WAC05292]RSS94246.1 ATP-binding protein [Streptomyces sp. WAC05292]